MIGVSAAGTVTLSFEDGPNLRGTLGPESVVLMHDGFGPDALRISCLETLRLIEPLVGLARELGLELRPVNPPAIRQPARIGQPAHV